METRARAVSGLAVTARQISDKAVDHPPDM